jgi:hydroxyacylglutathione hydrolase
VAGDVFAVASPLVSFYVLARDGAAVLIDTGASARRALAGLRQLGVEPRSVSHVFLTHSDSDHVGGLDLFPDAAVYMSAREQAVIDGTIPRRLFFLKHRNRFTRRYVPLEDDGTVSAGPFRVRAIWTPGHTPGSTCFLVDGTALFTGDLLGLHDGRARPSPRIICNDVAEDARSIRELARRVPHAELLCTGHGGWTLDYRAAMAEYLASSVS